MPLSTRRSPGVRPASISRMREVGIPHLAAAARAHSFVSGLQIMMSLGAALIRRASSSGVLAEETAEKMPPAATTP